jgi:chromosome partitioning protein
MHIIAITNQKGGCGKTTTAINLGASLATNGQRVLLIDLDPQAHASSGLNLKNPPLNIYNTLSKLSPKKATLEDIIVNVSLNFDLAPSGIILSTLEQELAGEIGREARLLQILNDFKSAYDYILIDCPPSLGILTINAIRASGELIIPVEASRFSLEGLHQLLDIITLVRERLNHQINYKILVVNFDSRLAHSFKMLKKIRDTFGENVFKTIIHINVKLKEAQEASCHILNYDKYCRGAKDYYSLSREIISYHQKSEESLSKTKEAPKEIPAPAPAVKPKPVVLSEVVFSLSAPDAKEVYLAGTFNDWKLNEFSRMERTGEKWLKKLFLRKGCYQYRFVVDGKWQEDPDNPLKEPTPFGGMNSLIRVNGY